MSCLVINPSLYLCFIGDAVRYWRQAGIGLRNIIPLGVQGVLK
jgi:hypothetical protein